MKLKNVGVSVKDPAKKCCNSIEWALLLL